MFGSRLNKDVYLQSTVHRTLDEDASDKKYCSSKDKAVSLRYSVKCAVGMRDNVIVPQKYSTLHEPVLKIT